MKHDQKAKTELTDEQVDALPAPKLRKLVQKGLAMLPDENLNRLIDEELSYLKRPRSHVRYRLSKREIN